MGEQPEDTFRDHISTTNEEGRRSWVYAARPSGKLHNYRSLVAIILLAIFFIVPFVRIQGEPFILINIFERHFVLFGKIFWPQDFHLFVIAMITFVIAIILFTVVYGRVWCGWACPQTIFLEMVYRKLEFWIEGSAGKQRKLDSGPFSFEKAWKKSLKHILYIIIAVLVIHTVVAYFIGIDQVFKLIESRPGENITAFSAISFFVFAYYFMFARFREQVCILACPYGRLQGVMLDANSLVVAYDYKRGEERGRFKKSENRRDQTKGDCIDCGSCLHVCPTGIDIRNGTQLECINCTACIDACNKVMGKVGFEPGLIRIASANEISEGRKFRLTGRIIAYTSLLFLLISALVVLFVLRSDIETTILRVPGSLFQQTETETSNIYNVKIINKTNRDIPIEIQLLNTDGRIQFIGQPIQLKAQQTGEGVFLIYLKNEGLNSSKIPLTFGIYSNGILLEKEKTTFVGP